jgi:hypothetical protein
MDGPMVFAISGHSAPKEPKGTTPPAEVKDPLISFDIIPLSPTRAEVTTECFCEGIYPYYARLLRAMVVRWPEVRPQLSGRYSFLTEQLGIEVAHRAEAGDGWSQQSMEGEGSEEAAGGQIERPLWEQIPEGRDRHMVRLWLRGYPARAIAARLDQEIVPKTVLNLICELRSIYGPDVVPYRKRPRKSRGGN